MSAYVPPWKRKPAEAAASTPPEAGPSTPLARTMSNGDHTLADVFNHLGGQRMGTINVFSYTPVPQPKKTVKDLIEEEKQREKRRAEKAERFRQRLLERQERADNPDKDNEKIERSSVSDPSLQPPDHPYSHLISWIHFMPATHPCFSTDQELWFHTHSRVLIDTQENLHRPIPMFGQSEDSPAANVRNANYGSRAGNVAFLGYWCVKAPDATSVSKYFQPAANVPYLLTI